MTAESDRRTVRYFVESLKWTWENAPAGKVVVFLWFLSVLTLIAIIALLIVQIGGAA